jgi:hypothetical protein
VHAQQIPPGVRYKKASAATNKVAYDFLKKLVTKVQPEASLIKGSSQVIICGPGMWTAIKGVAPKVLKDAMPITYKVPMGDGLHTLHGKGFKTTAQQIAFWELFQIYLDKYRVIPKNRPKGGIQVRKASASELSYHWALIAYDLEEPIYVVAIGKTSVLFEFTMDAGKPKVFNVDILGKIVK